MKKKQQGFTLIELLVTMAIIILLTVFSIPQFRLFGTQAELMENANQIAALVSKTQGLSLAPRTEDVNIDQYGLELSKIDNQTYWKVFKDNELETQREDIESGTLSKNIILDSYFVDNIPPRISPNTNVLELRFKITTGKIEKARFIGIDSGRQITKNLRIYLRHKKLPTIQQVYVDIDLVSGKVEVKKL